MPRWEILDAIACSWYRGRFLDATIRILRLREARGLFAPVAILTVHSMSCESTPYRHMVAHGPSPQTGLSESLHADFLGQLGQLDQMDQLDQPRPRTTSMAVQPNENRTPSANRIKRCQPNAWCSTPTLDSSSASCWRSDSEWPGPEAYYCSINPG